MTHSAQGQGDLCAKGSHPNQLQQEFRFSFHSFETSFLIYIQIYAFMAIEIKLAEAMDLPDESIQRRPAAFTRWTLAHCL